MRLDRRRGCFYFACGARPAFLRTDMRRLTVAAAALAAALPLAPASAAPMGGEEIRARSSGGEFRGFGNVRRFEDFIWRLRPDGTVTSISLIRRGGRDSGEFIEYKDTG